MSRATYIFALGVAGLSLAPAVMASDSTDAKSIFRKRCTACHTYGKGVKVGPDLKGVTDRRKRDWLVRFVSASSKMVQSDPTARKLFTEFKQERMPDWNADFSAGQISAILDYLAVNGPEQKEPDERHASTASVSEIEAGRFLFHARSPLTYRARACNTCHSIQDSAAPAGGSLGPNLTRAYSKYQDKALTDFLKHSCFTLYSESSNPNYLTPQESFNLKAYMARAGGLMIPAARVAPAATQKRGGL